MTVLILLDVIWRLFITPQSKIGNLLISIFNNFGLETTENLQHLVYSYIAPLITFVIFWTIGYLAVTTSASSAKYKRPLWAWLISFAIIAVASFGIHLFLWLFPAGLPWAQRLSLCLLLWVGFLGASIATFQARHVKIESIRNKMPAKIQPLLHIMFVFIATTFCLVIMTLGLNCISINWINWVTSGYTDDVFNTHPILPYWLVNAVIPISFATMAFRFVLRLFPRLLN